MAKLQAPFTSDAALFQDKPTLPAIFWEKYDIKRTLTLGERPLKVCDNLRQFYQSELDVDTLDDIFGHLWLAGPRRPPRSLSESFNYYKAITLNEDVLSHLLWDRDCGIYVKPFPVFLGSHSAWTETIVQDQKLHAQALGFLTSYMCLIRRESDFNIAQEHKLIPASVTWSKWVAMTLSVFETIQVPDQAGISLRYEYGELTSSRVRQIIFWDTCAPMLTTIVMTIRHFYGNYHTWTRKNLVFFGTVVTYVALVLTAMQVGLATNRLQDNEAFQRASYGFTVFSILGPLIILAVMSTGTFLWSCLTLFNSSQDSTPDAQTSA